MQSKGKKTENNPDTDITGIFAIEMEFFSVNIFQFNASSRNEWKLAEKMREREKGRLCVWWPNSANDFVEQIFIGDAVFTGLLAACSNEFQLPEKKIAP